MEDNFALLLKNEKLTVKTVNRYMVEFPESIGIPYYVVTSCTMPKVIEDGVIELQTTYPLIEDNTAYKYNRNPENASKKFDIKYKFLDEIGNVIGSFTLHGCTIEKISNSSLSYNENGKVNGRMTIRYAICDQTNQFINVKIPLVGDSL